MKSARIIIGLLILLVATTATAAIDCRTSGKTWHMIEGKRCWYDGPRVAKHRLRWAAVAPIKAKERPAPRPPIVSASPPPDTAMAFDGRVKLENFRIITPQVIAGAAEQPLPQTAIAPEIVHRAGISGGVMNGLMLFVLMIGVMLLFALSMLAIGLLLEARTRGRWDLRTLITPPKMMEWTPPAARNTGPNPPQSTHTKSGFAIISMIRS